MAFIKVTSEAPASTDEEHEAQLKELDLKWGATHVYRDRKGDFWTTTGYHPALRKADIDHNIKRMVEIMKVENLTYMGKDYDSDTYKSKQHITDWEAIMHMDSTNHLTAVTPELPITCERV